MSQGEDTEISTSIFKKVCVFVGWLNIHCVRPLMQGICYSMGSVFGIVSIRYFLLRHIAKYIYYPKSEFLDQVAIKNEFLA